MGEEGWAKEDLHPFWIRIENGKCIGGGMRLSQHKKYHFVYVLIVFYAFRTQQTLLLQCFSSLFIIREHKQHYLYNGFLLILLPEHNKLYCFNAFLHFLLPEHNKLYLFNASHFLCFLASLCTPSTPPSPTLPLDLA